MLHIFYAYVCTYVCIIAITMSDKNALGACLTGGYPEKV